MNIRRSSFFLFVSIFFLSACDGQAQTVPPTAALIQPTEAPAGSPTESPTEIQIDLPSSTDPSLFAALEKSKLDPLASNIQDAVFITGMDGFIASGNIIEYQIVSSEVFPSSDGTLIVQIYYSVRTTDPSWLVDGGTQVENNWITDKCNRFDFVNTETDFQLKNRRTCN